MLERPERERSGLEELGLARNGKGRRVEDGPSGDFAPAVVCARFRGEPIGGKGTRGGVAGCRGTTAAGAGRRRCVGRENVVGEEDGREAAVCEGVEMCVEVPLGRVRVGEAETGAGSWVLGAA
jgi:hypothetical protein